MLKKYPARIALICFLTLSNVLLANDFPVLVEDAPDNSQAFAAFHRQGLLPVPENAKPGRVVDTSGGSIRISHGYGLNYDGWFWTNEDGELQLLHGNRMATKTVVVGYPRGRTADEDTLYVMEADLRQDLRNHFDRTIQMRDRNFSHTSSPREVGQQMILAVRLHETGHSDLANQLAAHLFDTAGKRETLLAAVSAIHDLTYADFFRDYMSDHDLAALITNVEGLLQRARNTWLQGEIAAEQVDTWKQALADAPAVPENFSDLQSAFFNAFVDLGEDERTLIQTMQGDYWLLRPKRLIMQHLRYRVENPRKAERFLERFLALGPDAIPVLAALQEHPRLLPIDARSARFYGGMHHIHASEDFQRQQQLQDFPRPTPISTLAKGLLVDVLPDADHRTDSDLISAAADSFYDTIKGKSRLEIAQYLYEQNPSLDALLDEVAFTILASGDAAFIQKIRTEILSSGDLLDISDLIFPESPLISGEDGEAFLTTYLEAVRTQHETDMAEEHSWRGRQARQVLQRFDQDIPTQAPTLSLEELVEDVLAGNTAQFARLQTQGYPGITKDFVEIQHIILPKMLEASDAQANSLHNMLVGLYTRALLANMSHYSDIYDGHAGTELAFYLNQDADITPEDAEALADAALDDEFIDMDLDIELELVSELWLPLLEQEATPANRKRQIQLAAMVLGIQQDEDAVDVIHPIWNNVFHVAPELTDLLTSLARQSLAGEIEDLSAHMPTADQVPEARAEAIRAALTAADAAAALSVLQTRDLHEMMLISDLLKTPEVQSNDDLWSQLTEQRRTIAYVQESFQPFADAGFTVDTRLTTEVITALLQTLQAEARTGGTGRVEIHERNITPGIVAFHETSHMFGSGTGEGEVSLFIMGISGGASRMAFSLDETISLQSADETPDDDVMDLMSMLGQSWQSDGASGLEKWLRVEDVSPGNTAAIYIMYSAPDEYEIPVVESP